MTKKLLAFYAIAALSFCNVGHAQEKSTEQVLLDNLKKTMGDVNAADAGGETLLHWAARKNYPKIIRYLLNNGADADILDSHGRTPLHIAINNLNPGSRQIITMLKRGARTGARKIMVRKTPTPVPTEQKSSTDSSQSPAASVAPEVQPPQESVVAPTATSYEELYLDDATMEAINELQAMLKKREDEVAVLQGQMETLKNKVKASRKSDKKKMAMLNNTVSDLKKRLAAREKQYSQLQDRISSFEFFGLFKLEYMFATVDIEENAEDKAEE